MNNAMDERYAKQPTIATVGTADRDRTSLIKPTTRIQPASDPARRTGRTNDPEATKANILDVSTREFAKRGYDGARIDAIAEQTKTSKRMLYYYFGSKQGLYQAVLVNYYKQLRAAESKIDVANLAPLAALRQLTCSTFEYHVRNADVVRLVMVENIAKGRHMDSLPSLEPINSVLIKTLAEICRKGADEGVMRTVDPTRLYMSIAALCFFNVSNRYTFERLFDVDMTSAEALDRRMAEVWDMVERYVTI